MTEKELMDEIFPNDLPIRKLVNKTAERINEQIDLILNDIEQNDNIDMIESIIAMVVHRLFFRLLFSACRSVMPGKRMEFLMINISVLSKLLIDNMDLVLEFLEEHDCEHCKISVH